MPDLAGDDAAMRKDFLATRGAAAQGGGDAWMRQAAEAGGAAPAAPAAERAPYAGGAAQLPAYRELAPGEPIPNAGGAAALPTPLGQRIISGIGAVARDLGRGATETPIAIARGAVGAVEQMGKAGVSFENWRDEHLPDWVTRYVYGGMTSEDRDAFQKLTGRPYGEALGEAQQAVDLKGAVAVPPTTYTGATAETIAQWSTAQAILGGPLEALAGTGLAGQALKDFAGGALGLDPHATRLSNLVDQVAPNWFTDFLKARPASDGENEAMARVKSGLEFAGLGAVFEAVKRGAVAIKDFVTGPEAAPAAEKLIGATEKAAGEQPAAAGQAAAAGEAAPGAVPAAPPKPFLPLGDQAADPVTISPTIKADAARYLAGEGGPNPVKINLERIGSSQDIADTLERISTMLPDDAVQSHDATIAAADALGLTPQDFLKGYRGQQLDAAQTTAMRFMLDSGASQVIDYAKIARDPTTATPEAQATFLRAFATQRGLQQYFENARAEAGRNLNAYQIMSRQTSDQAKAIADLIKGAGGTEDVTTIADRIAALGDPTKASALIGQMSRMSGRQSLLYGYYNLLLSNPRTIVKKGMSDTGVALWNTATRYMAEKLGPSGEVQPGEAAALLYGYTSSLKDAVRIAGRALAAGESQFYGEFSTVEGANARLNIMAGNAPDLAPGEPTKAALDYLKSALPTSWIGAADDFAKFANYRAEVRALAYREATGTGATLGMSGDEMSQAIENMMTTVPQHIHEQALASALRSTFQEPLQGFAQKFQQTFDTMNLPLPHTDLEIPAGRILMPFIKVPTNIMRMAYRNSPLPLAFPSSALRGELAAGGAVRDLALARIGLGTAASLAVADLAITGTMTGRGPRDPTMNRAWRAAGNEPYSVRVGDTWYQYNQVEPFGLLMGSIADSIGVMRFAKDQDSQDIAASLIFGTGDAMMSKTYMTGLATFLDALAEPEKQGEKWTDRLVSSVVTPQGVAALHQATDPWLRAHYGLIDGIEARVPGLAQTLPPLRSLWGDPIPAKDGFLPPISTLGELGMPGAAGAARALSPIAMAPAGQGEPIDKWIWENRLAFPQGPQGRLGISKPGLVQSFGDAPHVSTQLELTPQELDRLQVLAGNTPADELAKIVNPNAAPLTFPGAKLGARDALNALVAGDHPDRDMQHRFNDASPAVQALMVMSEINRYRGAAKRALAAEFRDIRDALDEGFKAKRQQLNAAPGGGAPAAPRMQ